LRFCEAKSLIARGAQGIAAEILFCRKAAKKIGAESPVFARQGAQKCADKDTLLILKSPFIFFIFYINNHKRIFPEKRV
jgi:hypothetical protein